MMISIKSFLISLIICFTLQAQDLILLTDDGVSYEAETLTYQTRVLADGGEIIDLDAVNNFYKDAKANDYLDTLNAWYELDFGVGKNANNKLTKWYDASPNNRDLAQADTSKAPTWNADSIYFDGANDLMVVTATYASGTVYMLMNHIGETFNDYNGAYSPLTDAVLAGHGIIGINASNAFLSAGSFFEAIYRNGVLLNDTPFDISVFAMFRAEDTGVVSSPNYQLGHDRADAGRFWKGRIDACGVLKNVLSTTKSTALETYLNTKYTTY